MEFELVLQEDRAAASTPLGSLYVHGIRGNAAIQGPHAQASTSAAPPSPLGISSTSTSLIPYKPPLGGIPVPTLFAGKVFAPIPASRATIGLETLEVARQLGLASMLARALGPAESPDRFWRVSAFSDPLTAANVEQACDLDGRKMFFVERGSAEALARGRVTMQVDKKRMDKERKTRKKVKKGPGLHKAFKPIEDFINKLRWNKEVNDDIKLRTFRAHIPESTSHGKQLEPSPHQSTSDPQPSTSSSQKDLPPSLDSTARPGQHLFQLKGSVNPIGMLRSTEAHAHLAIIPVRVALNLLRGLPGSFMLMAVDDDKKGGRLDVSPRSGKLSTATKFRGADTLSDVEVHAVPELQLTLKGLDGQNVQFTPAFLSRSHLHAFWKAITAFTGAQVLAHRRLQRATFRMRLQHAAAIIAGGTPPAGIAGPSEGARDSDDDDGRGGFDEPPEIRDLLQEMGEMPGMGAAGGGSAASSGLVRAGATLACGMITLIGPFVELAGALADQLLLELPFGPDALGVATDAKPRAYRLNDLVMQCQEYNTAQAAALVKQKSPEEILLEYRKTLAAQALWLAVLAKMVAEDGQLQRLLDPRSTALKTKGGGTPLVRPNSIVVDASKYDPDDPNAAAAAVMGQYLPFLEHNGFAREFVDGGPDGGATPEMQVAQRLLGQVVSMELIATAPSQHQESSTTTTTSRSRSSSVLSGSDGERAAPLGRGLIVIGDLDLQSKRKTGGRGLVMEGGRSFAIGLEDGAKFF